MNRNNELQFSDEQAMILDSAREFCRDKSPIAAVRALLDSETGFDPGVWQEMVELGWLGLTIPEEYGGSGLGVGTAVALAECMGRHLLSTPFLSSTLVAQAVLRAGNSAQKDDWLPRLATGTIASPALLDGGDWGDTETACIATQDGDTITLSGEKYFVSDAETAELLLVFCQLQGQAALVLVEASQLPAGAVQGHVLLDQTRRGARLSLEGVSVPSAALLELDKTAATLRDIRLLGALLIAAEATGSTAACLDTVVEYLKTRKQFGKLIGSYQALKHPTVDILCQLDAARSLIYHAATIVGDSALDDDAEIACRMAKATAGDALAFAGDRAVQFHGGMGFTYECDAQLYIRRGQWTQQQFGDAWHHRKRLASLLLDS
ncbi:MAG: acyl-CoA dehydrogenase family protein [Halieaceae bacterium]